MDLSGIPKPAMIIASLTGLAAIAGGTLAIVQPHVQPQASDPIAVRSIPTSPSPPSQPGLTSSKPIAAKAKPAQTRDTDLADTEEKKAAEQIDNQNNNSGKDNSGQESPRLEASRTVEACKITMARIEDPESPVNIRSKPNTKTPDTIVGTVKNGTYVTVLEEQAGWFKISTPQKGWIAKRLTAHGCNSKTERVNFGSQETSTVLTDEFIGTGMHDYRLRFSKGQKLRVASKKGPLPTIVAPDGRTLHTLSDEGSVWSGTLTTSGDYKVIFESNFKGYTYSAEIEATS
jgi:Bacterial SH3 domain